MSSTPVRPWLGSFIRESLSSYLSQDEPNEHIVNDGTCLSFKNFRQEPWCSIIHWNGQGPNPASAALMDPDWQINASITHDPGITKNANPKRHIAQLLDFKLILHYSKPKPEVYLRVDRLHIDWERGVQKVKAAKSFKKNQEFKNLVEQVCHRIKSHESVPGHFGPTGLAKGPSPASQSEPQEDLQKGSFSQISSQQFLSQVAPAWTLEKERHVGSVSGPSRGDLLLHLNSHHGLRSGELPASSHIGQVDPQAESSPLQVNHSNRPPEILTGQHISVENPPEAKDRRRESSVSSQPDRATRSSSYWTHVLGATTWPTVQELTSTQAVGAIPESRNTMHEATPGSPSTATRKRQRDDGSPSLRNADALASMDAGAVSPFKKTKHLGDHVGNLPVPKSVPLIETIEPRKANPPEPQSVNVKQDSFGNASKPRPDPWKGLTRISGIDVTIPKDQKALFGNPNEAWIPPKPGLPQPHAHVPPSLLKAWNETAVRKRDAGTRNAEEREAEQKNAIVEPPIPQTQETHESEDSGREYSWSPSPERDTTKPSGIPPSSPVRGDDSVETRISKPSRKVGTSHVSGKSVDRSDANVVISGFQQEHEAAKSQDVADHPRVDDNQSQKDLNGDATMTEAQAPSPSIDQHMEESGRDAWPSRNSDIKDEQGHVNSPSKQFRSNSPLSEDESDNESMMDTSVPVALGEVLPDPTQSTQNGQELMSSGPSLPAPDAEYVQVSETPAVGGSHLQYRKGFSRRDGPDSPNQHASPSKDHKSSSQSRIMNTFPPQGSHEEGQSSRGTGNPSTQSQEAESIRVDVPGTQSQISMNSTSESQNASTNSQPDIVLESSGRPERHQKLLHPGTETTGHPASSLNVPVSHEKSLSQVIETVQRSPLSQSESKALSGNTPCPPPRHAVGNPTHKASAEDPPMKGFFTGRLERPVSSGPKAVTAAIEVVIPNPDKGRSPRAISEPMQEKAHGSQESDIRSNVFQSTDGSNESPPSPTIEIAAAQSSPVKSRRTTAQSIETPAKVEEIDETDMEDMDDLDDTHHETASVELGDDSYVSHASPQVAESTSSDTEVEDAESESENENWFVSLRHIRRPRVGWSQTTNTPFKSWAKAELNSFSELRRRGWVRAQVDGRGIVRRLANG